MTKTRASMVCEPTLAFCAQEIDLGGFLLLGKGEEHTGGRERDSIVSDAMEALIGAIYLDGGFANAKEFIHRFILNDMEHKKLFYDSKTILQEIVQGHYRRDTYIRSSERRRTGSQQELRSVRDAGRSGDRPRHRTDEKSSGAAMRRTVRSSLSENRRSRYVFKEY